MKVSRKELNQLYKYISEIVDSKTEKYVYGLLHACIRNKHKIKNFIEEMMDQQKMFQEQTTDLFLKYCNRDKDGKPIDINSGEKPEFDVERKDLEKISADYWKEEVEFESYTIDKKYFPKEDTSIIGAVGEVIFYFGKDEEKKD